MRLAILIAFACVLAATAFNEDQFREELPVSNEELTEAQGPVEVPANTIKNSETLTETELAQRGPYWKWTNHFKTEADGKHRLRQLWKNGKPVEKDWTLIKVSNKSDNKPRSGRKTKTKPAKKSDNKELTQAGWGTRRRRHRHRRHHHRRSVLRYRYRHGLWMCQFWRGVGGLSNLNQAIARIRYRHPNVRRWAHYINYQNTGGHWRGLNNNYRDNFVGVFSALVRFFRSGRYGFMLGSDDGSKLWIDGRYTINNDGLHGYRNRVAYRNVRAGWRKFIVQFFERGGHAGLKLHYRGPDTGNRWRLLRAAGTRVRRRVRHRWIWGRMRRVGNHLMRQRILQRFIHRRWRNIRVVWKLWRRNHYRRRSSGCRRICYRPTGRYNVCAYQCSGRRRRHRHRRTRFTTRGRMQCNNRAAATKICKNLASMKSSNTKCGGFWWKTGKCGGGVELLVDRSSRRTCQCLGRSNSFTWRPCIGNRNWGGWGKSCNNAKTQRMFINCDGISVGATMRRGSTRAGSNRHSCNVMRHFRNRVRRMTRRKFRRISVGSSRL